MGARQGPSYQILSHRVYLPMYGWYINAMIEQEKDTNNQVNLINGLDVKVSFKVMQVLLACKIEKFDVLW